MSLTATDIVFYATTNMPLNDTDLTGGDIDSGIRVVFDDIAATDQIEVVSDNAGDTQNITIVGRNAAGQIITDTFAMAGTSTATSTESFERVFSAIAVSAANGTITVRDQDSDTTIGQIFANESGFRRPFYDATANAAGGADKELYEKIFVMNNNTGNALLNATVVEVASGIYTKVNFGFETDHQSTQAVSNRTTVPTGVGSYGTGSSGVPNTDLGTRDYLGIWLQLDLDAGDAAQNSFYQLQVDGSTT